MHKNFSVLLIYFISNLSLADALDPAVLKKSPIVLSGVESLHRFEENFEVDGAELSKELVGFNSKSVTPNEKASVIVYNIPLSSTVAETKLQNSNYDCGYSKDEAENIQAAKCVFTENNNERAYSAAQGFFTVQDFQDAAVSFVNVFEEAFGDPAQLSEVKFWRSTDLNNEANIQVKYQWTDTQGVANIKYMFCHKHAHGDELEMDCHRQRDIADPFQPNRLARAERFQP